MGFLGCGWVNSNSKKTCRRPATPIARLKTADYLEPGWELPKDWNKVATKIRPTVLIRANKINE